MRRGGDFLRVAHALPRRLRADAVAALGSFDVGPLLAYTLADIVSLRFVLVGVVLVYLVQNRPEGLLGHRKETAAAVSLSRDKTEAARTDGDTTGGER